MFFFEKQILSYFIKNLKQQQQKVWIKHHILHLIDALANQL